MKREAFRHPKTLDLAARLGLTCHAYAFAHVSYMLNAAADIAPQGNIGKWPNGVIARNAEWTADADAFVTALVDSGWLDKHPDPSIRLLIHDWPDHAERFIKSKLSREGIWFHAAYYPEGGREWDAPDGIRKPQNGHIQQTTLATVVATTVANGPCDPTQPNQSQPIPTQPIFCAREAELEPKAPKKPSKAKAYSAAFAAWFAAYPRRVAKDAAAKAYDSAVRRIGLERQLLPIEAADWLLQITGAFAKSEAGNNGEFTPHPATWLNAGRYNDDQRDWHRQAQPVTPADKRRAEDRRDQDYVAPQ